MAYIPKLHCHSSFEHYEMYHANRSSGYGNSIFNTTYNFNGGTICGGGFLGGLFGGLGMGLGAGLMSWLGGGMFGGGMGMFGGGFPMMNMWGGGFPFMNGWGGGGVSDGAGGRNSNTNTNTSTNTTTTTTNTNEKVVEKECDNKDDKIINDLRVELNTLKSKEELTQEEINALHDKVKKAKDESDEHHKTEDNRAYDLLLEDINKLKPKTKEPEPENNPITNNNGTLTLHFGVRDDKNNVIDDKIQGRLIGVKSETNDNKTEVKTYVIDSSDFPGQKFGLRYKITKNPNGTYNVKCINKKHHNCSAYKKLYINPDGVNYTIGADRKLHNTGTDFVVSTQYHDGYLPIDYKADKLQEEEYEMPELDNDYEEIEDNEEENIKIRKKTDEE